MCWLHLFLSTNAQEYPTDWAIYTTDEYLHDIQNDFNSKNLSEQDFKNLLVNNARTNLAKQIQIHVKDISDLNKSSENGQTSIIYSATTTFTTDVNLKLVETKTSYNAVTKRGYAIAYINRNNARNYYNNELTLIYNKINNSITLAKSFIDAGFKSKAKSELQSSLQTFNLYEEPLICINLFGATQQELFSWSECFNSKKQEATQMLTELEHSTTIFLSCVADIFGISHPTLSNELKGILSKSGCNFTHDPNNADWCIIITCKSREYSKIPTGNSDSHIYFTYVDAHISIEKVLTSQRICEDEISCKGGHTFGYSEAARIGYKEIKNKIAQNIKNFIGL